MGTQYPILEAWELLPILLLLVVGGFIAIRSGVRRLTSREELGQVFTNLSQIVLRILAYGAAMLVVHEWIGMRTTLGW